jgi:hypothetical protein
MLYANSMPFYIRDMSIHRFWYPCVEVTWNQPSVDMEG